MKLHSIILMAALCVPLSNLHAQGQIAPGGGVQQSGSAPIVATAAEAQSWTIQQAVSGEVQMLAQLEARFDSMSRLVTNNPLFLTQEQVVAGFSPEFNRQFQASGALLISTCIKTQAALAPFISAAPTMAQNQYATSVKWLAQDRIKGWIAAYKLDPNTGDFLANASP